MIDAKNYALAAFAAASDPWLDTLSDIRSRLDRDPSLLEKLSDNSVAFSIRSHTLEDMLPYKLNEGCRKFLLTLIEANDLRQLGTIIDWMVGITNGGPQTRMAIITTAYELDSKEQQMFADKVEQIYGTGVGISFLVDSNIIGGAVVRIGDQVMDGSIKTKMEALESSIAG